jgi:hypothetical protein
MYAARGGIAAGSAAIGHLDETMIGDRDAMRVAGQIVQYVFPPAERPLGVDYPVLAEQSRKWGPLHLMPVPTHGLRDMSDSESAQVQYGSVLQGDWRVRCASLRCQVESGSPLLKARRRPLRAEARDEQIRSRHL